MNNIIIGAGISGISCSYHLNEGGLDSLILEKDSDWGGLIGNFEIDGFRFDRFVHFTFTNDSYVRNIFENSSECYSHLPESMNYYKKLWIRHPAQNNLFPLSTEEKVKIIKDFVNKQNKDVINIKNYEEWLRIQYGDYFAENFPFRYTKKYWTVEPSRLETKWVGNRMHQSSLEEVLRGAFESNRNIDYYTKEMRYPKKGGFKSILNNLAKQCDIRLKSKVNEIDPVLKTVTLENGDRIEYDNLISSMPLPAIIKLLPNVPKVVIEASERLLCTSGYQISIGLKKENIPKYLWFYIYDEDILPARVYSPSMKSSDNVPAGCSSIQAEVYFSNENSIDLKEEKILDHVIDKLVEMNVFTYNDILVKDIRLEKYANVVFTHDIYSNRNIVKEYLNSLAIYSIGRFGEWKYLWSDQSFNSGKKCAEMILKEIGE